MSRSVPRFAILVAAGSSSRMGFDKTLADLRGHPLIWHTLKAFSEVPGMEEIVVVTAKEKVGEVHEIAREFAACHMVVRGGEHRIDSVIRGLEALGQDEGLVAVHDAARPLITPETISNAFECAEKFGASACAEPLVDTLHRVDDVGCIEKNIDRQNLWRMQTPQVFPPTQLLEVLRQTKGLKNPPTDDAGAFLIAGRSVHISPNLQPNFKITYPGDLILAEAVLTNLHQ
jgi:2-C-methyl-D-erythritol 4-phosphate cytidylyltransferase